VAEASMRALSLDTLEICPWALREGLILRKLDTDPGTDPGPGSTRPIGVPGPTEAVSG